MNHRKIYPTLSLQNRVVKGPNRRRPAFKVRPNFDVIKKYLVGLAVLFLSIGGIYSAYRLYKSDFFVLSKIEVKGPDTYVNNEDVLAISSSRIKSQSLFSFNNEDLTKALLESFNGARGFIVKKEFPNEIDIVVVEREPAITLRSNDQYYLADVDGFVLGVVAVPQADIPVINYVDKIEVNNYLRKDQLPLYLNTVEVFSKNGINYSSLSFSQTSISVYLNNDILAVLNPEKDIRKSVLDLNKLLDYLLIQGKKVKSVDLRFNKAIVEYKN